MWAAGAPAQGPAALRQGLPHCDASAKRARYSAPALLLGCAISRRWILGRRAGSVRSRRIAGRRHGGEEGEARSATNGTQRPQRGACAPFWRGVRPRGADDGGSERGRSGRGSALRAARALRGGSRDSGEGAGAPVSERSERASRGAVSNGPYT